LDIVVSGTTRTALDLSREPQKSRDRYRGVEQFLTARRLVEAGVGCVTLAISNAQGGDAWDTHGGNFEALRKSLLPQLDRGLSSLIQDLQDRGRDPDVFTVVGGEFGREPRINENAGRHHWLQAMSVLVAGGGLKMGQAIGSTSPRAEHPRERPYRVAQVLSTL